MIRVLMADDHPIVRKGLKQLMIEAGDMEVSEAGSIPEVRGAMAAAAPDVLILDVSMPGGSGLEFLAEVQRAHPRLPVLILSAFDEKDVGVRAFIAGARGFLNKQSAPERIVEAVRTLHAGRRYITPELAELVAGYVQNPAQSSNPHLLLSERETTVLRMMVAGKGTSEIANELGLSPKTVSTFRTRIFEKMGMKSTAELVRYVLERGPRL